MRFAIALVLVFASLTSADTLVDYRWGEGACPTWTTDTENGTIKGKWTEAAQWMRQKETWTKGYTKRIGWHTIAGSRECKYKGDAPPTVAEPVKVDAAGNTTYEWVVKGAVCKPKTVKPFVCKGGANDGKFCQSGNPNCPGGTCVSGTQVVTDYPWSWAGASYARYETSSNPPEPWEETGNAQGCTYSDYVYGAPPA